MKMENTKRNAIDGALKRAEERPSNDLPMEAYQARQESATGWNNWPDWDNGPDFPNWEDIGGPPPK